MAQLQPDTTQAISDCHSSCSNENNDNNRCKTKYMQETNTRLKPARFTSLHIGSNND